MPQYYRNGPPNSDVDNLSLDGDSSKWPSRRSSAFMPFKTSVQNHSTAETTSSSASDLPTPARFVDSNKHPSVYLRERDSENPEKSKKLHAFSEFNVKTKNSVRQVDYSIPDRNRPLEVRVDNRSIFIDPRAAKEFSPQISAFLLREYAAGHKRSVEPKIEDLHYDEILEAVRAICPTDFGLFATPVSASTFSTLARMSYVFQVEKLKQACELYIARLPLKLEELNAAFAAILLNDSFKYGLNKSTKIRMLQGVIGLIIAEIQDPTRLPTYSSKNTNILPLVGHLIDASVEDHKKGRLAHGEMLNEARLKIPCRSCRMEEPQSITQPAFNELQVCSLCRQTICRKCIRRPCATLVEQFMSKFTKEFGRN